MHLSACGKRVSLPILRRSIVFILIGLFLPLWVQAGDWQVDSELNFQARSFLNPNSYGSQVWNSPAIEFKPKLSFSLSEGKHLFRTTPVFRRRDRQDSHFDFKRFSYLGIFDQVEVSFGYDQFFWGVAESINVVNIINQLDLADDITGESRFGQSYFSFNYISETMGSWQFLGFPNYRYRSFPGSKERFRGPFIEYNVNGGLEEPAVGSNFDYALRWSKGLDRLEWAVFYFYGVDRDPNILFIPNTYSFETIYHKANQIGLEGQYTGDQWIFKTEVLEKDPLGDSGSKHYLSVTGFEYLYGLIGNQSELTFIGENIVDTRHESSPLGLFNHLFLGTRLDINNTSSSVIEAGLFFNKESQQTSLSVLEFETRLTNQWKLQSRAVGFLDPAPGTLGSLIKEDDYFELNLSYFF